MDTIITILVGLVVLGVLIFVHELGHYGVGRLLGFTIVEFSLGMGPRLIKKEKNGIIYSLRMLPIGGMCQFYGEDQDVKDARCFNYHKPWKRALVLAAGPLMNIIFAVLLSIVTLAIYGDIKVVELEHPIVSDFSFENSPAQDAGILVGDEIVAIDSVDVNGSDSLSSLILAADDDVDVTVLRDGETLTKTVKRIYDEKQKKNVIGISFATATQERVRYGALECIGQSFGYVGQVFDGMIQFFKMLFTGQLKSGDVAGPVGTISLIGQAARAGFEVVLRLAILLSINLGLFNIIPFPALDGGRLVFVGVEAVRGKPIPPEKEGIVHLVGLFLLFALIIFITYNDIVNLFAK